MHRMIKQQEVNKVSTHPRLSGCSTLNFKLANRQTKMNLICCLSESGPNSDSTLRRPNCTIMKIHVQPGTFTNCKKDIYSTRDSDLPNMKNESFWIKNGPQGGLHKHGLQVVLYQLKYERLLNNSV